MIFEDAWVRDEASALLAACDELSTVALVVPMSMAEALA
jgi:hypothetical protein